MFATAVVADDDAPSVDLLEFLSQWHDEQGELLDPMMFDDPPGEPAEKNDENVDAAR